MNESSNHFCQIARRDINDLLANNKEWIRRKTADDPKFFEKVQKAARFLDPQTRVRASVYQCLALINVLRAKETNPICYLQLLDLEP